MICVPVAEVMPARASKNLTALLQAAGWTMHLPAWFILCADERSVYCARRCLIRVIPLV
jgi:hypothetical protein